MLRFGEVYLAELLFHELTHQKVYLSGDTDFNEALASAVAEIATVKWLFYKAATEGLQPTTIEEYRQALEMREDFDELIAMHKTRLQTLYDTVSVEALNSDVLSEKRAAKQELNTQLIAEYQMERRQQI